MAITVTNAAAQRIRKGLEQRGKGIGLRIGVKSSGCSGFAYIVDFVDVVESDDNVYEEKGVKVVVDAESLKYIDGTELDFGLEGLNESFKFNNPKITATCGCGESFTVT